MTALFKETTVIALLTTEIKSNFTQQQKEKLHFLIGTSDIVDYAGIKLLAKNIKNYLVDKSYTIKHGQVLNILAKSYGFSNHHSMTASLEQSIQTFKGTTNLFKMFQARKELFDFFNENNITFKVYDSRVTEFSLIYTLNDSDISTFEDGYDAYNYYKRRKSEKYQMKLAINKLVRKYNIEPHKNTLPLVRFIFSKREDMYKIRYLIVKEYQAFFKPHFLEGKENTYTVIAYDKGFIFINYNDIRYTKSFLYVGSYSNDLEWDEIKNFLTFLLRYGEVEDYIFVESLLKQEKTLPEIGRDKLSKKLLLRKYEQFKFTEDFMNEYKKIHTKSLKSILESMRLVISLSKEDMILLNKYAEDVSNVVTYYDFMNNLSQLLINTCIENFNTKDRYSAIEKDLYLEFLHYDAEEKITIVKNDNTNKDNILITCLAQLVEKVCQRIEKITKDNNLKLEDINNDIEYKGLTYSQDYK